METTRGSDTGPLRPVVVASSSNLHLWPLSRIQLPIQFQKAGEEPSAYQQGLMACQAVSPETAPLVCASTSTLALAVDQFDELNLPFEPQFLVEPAERGGLNSVLAACLLATRKEPVSTLAIFDASRPARDRDALQRLFQQILPNPAYLNDIIVCAELAETTQGGALARGESLGAAHLYRPLPGELSRLAGAACSASLVVCRADRFVTYAQQCHSSALRTVCLALDNAHQLQNGLWLAPNYWSLLESSNLSDYVRTHHDDFLIRPVDIGSALTPVFGQEANAVMEDSLGCKVLGDGHLVAVAGCSELNIVSTPDVTLIADRASTASLHNLVEALREQQRPEVFNGLGRPQRWGQDILLDKRAGYSVHRLEIWRGQQLSLQPQHDQSVSWTVLSGEGEVMFGKRNCFVDAGARLLPARDEVTTLVNTGRNPLHVLEVRQQDQRSGEGDLMDALSHVA